MAVREPIRNGWLTQGPKVKEFEEAFARRHAVRHAVATTSCTTALHLALLSLDVGEGDEVIVPSFTWVASANAVVYCGATPVFVDIDRTTYNIDPLAVSAAVTDRTKALVAVHMFGLAADVEAIRDRLPSSVAILEDAACAAGADYKGQPVGNLGTAAAFSFHPRKTITTGEGGMITTSSDAVAARAARLRNHGASVAEEVRHGGPTPYILPTFDVIGFNYRMTDIQAAIGLVQLKKLDALVSERREAATLYAEGLEDLTWLMTPREDKGYRHAWQAYVCYVDPETAPMSRNELMARLLEMGISTRPGTHAVHRLAYYLDRHQAGLECPVSELCEEQTLAIPLHNRMSADDYRYVIDAMHLL